MPTGFSGALYTLKLSLGTDSSGRSIFIRSLYSAKIAIQVGGVVALAAVLIGAILGSLAGYYGGWVDASVTWLYSTLSSLPQLVLLGVITFMFLGTKVEGSLIPVYIALTLTFWIGTCRVIRGEVLKLKELEYVQAGKAIGFNRLYILRKHVLPNTMHLLFINFSLLFIGAIKTEVVLTYLGLGIKDGSSWGRMISDSAPEVVSGFFWQISAATVFMLVLVLAFNVLSDALQDAFDPKHVG
jgi:peptide/nickel transport system permease protein